MEALTPLVHRPAVAGTVGRLTDGARQARGATAQPIAAR
jgi:hypothetical protein